LTGGNFQPSIGVQRKTGFWTRVQMTIEMQCKFVKQKDGGLGYLKLVEGPVFSGKLET